MRPSSSLIALAKLAGVVFILSTTTTAASSTPSNRTVARQPNVLFLFTDDQDLLLGSLQYVDAVTERIQKQGFTFDNHHATVSLCCPSRVALLRGQHAHNTNITYVSPPGGGYEKFVASTQDQDYLPHWVNWAGYRAEHIGKLMNGYGTSNYANSPKGWDHFDGLLDPYTYIYNTPIFSANGETPIYYAGQHQTDVIRAKAVTRLKILLAGDKPWFLTVAPVAPHQQFNKTGRWPPVPLARHLDLYPGLKAPRTPNFNPREHRKPSWVGELPYMDEVSIAFSDETYRRRAQVLAGVNEMFHELLDILEAAGELENTYVIFSADHGYHLGQHRVPAGKTLPYREDTQVPFIIRGPGVPHGRSSLPSNHVDLAPTILKFMGLPREQWPTYFDGRDLSAYWVPGDDTSARTQLHPTPETIQIEYWGSSVVEASGVNVTMGSPRNTYKTVRIIGEDYGYLYSHWCTNETEVYDTVADPYELSPLDMASPEHAALGTRLNGLLLASKSCELDACRSPWSTLHPDGTVTDLRDALNSAHDDFYAALPRVAFKECLDYQLHSNEEPYYPPFTDGVGPTLGALYQQPLGSSGANIQAHMHASSGPRAVMIEEEGRFGSRYEGPEAIEASARRLTAEEIGPSTAPTRDFYTEL